MLRAMTTRYWIDTWIARIDAAEYGLCRRLNCGASSGAVRQVFRTASRLGDGMVWYALMMALPLLYGTGGPANGNRDGADRRRRRGLVQMAQASGGARAAFHDARRPLLGAAPLDRYSFPSGHTLHAVSFTWQAVAAFPELAWVLVPLALLVAASRVVLGLHYPTDVMAGAAIGSVMGTIGTLLT